MGRNHQPSGDPVGLGGTEPLAQQMQACIESGRRTGRRQHAPVFNPGTLGVQIHPRIEAAAGDAPRVVKHFADAFEQTSLQQTLAGLNVDELILCGRMTQNCVTHTALSRRADDYRQTTVLTDATTTISQILHLIALNGLSTRVRLANSAEALA